MEQVTSEMKELMGQYDVQRVNSETFTMSVEVSREGEIFGYVKEFTLDEILQHESEGELENLFLAYQSILEDLVDKFSREGT